jgi:hypothetical protein
MSVLIHRNNFPILSALSNTLGTQTIEASALKPGLAKEIQTILKSMSYYSGDIDGIPGEQTLAAIARFKNERWLGLPNLIGVQTIDSLLEGEHPDSEQISTTSSPPRLIMVESLNTRTGRNMLLPNGNTVWENQLIVEGIPLTWGEFSKGCTRIPQSNTVVQGAIKFAKNWGWVRNKWNSAIQINSGYRTPAVNRAIGGATYSRHMQGDAGDISPVSGSIYDLLNVVKSSPFIGIGLGMRKGFIHCDCRPGGRIVFNY